MLGSPSSFRLVHHSLSFSFSPLHHLWFFSWLTVLQPVMPASWGVDDVSRVRSLLIFVVTRILGTFIVCNLAIPCGDFLPTFAIGGGVGRLIGEVMLLAGLKYVR